MVWDNDIPDIAFKLHGPEPIQVDLARCWIDELNGNNSVKAAELMAQVVEGELTREGALALLSYERK
jgi:hypothetical protein